MLSVAHLPRCAFALWRAWWWAPCHLGSPPRPLSSSSSAAPDRERSRSAAGPPSASAPPSGSRTDAGPWRSPLKRPCSRRCHPPPSQSSLGCLAPLRGWTDRKGTCLPSLWSAVGVSRQNTKRGGQLLHCRAGSWEWNWDTLYLLLCILTKRSRCSPPMERDIKFNQAKTTGLGINSHGPCGLHKHYWPI